MKMCEEIEEVEKLYEVLGLFDCPTCMKHGSVDCYYLCENKHAPFTVEKQIELMKWLAKRNSICIDMSDKVYIATDYSIIDNWYNEEAEHKTFEGALAGLMLRILKNLKGSEKDVEEERIRGILK